MKVYLKILSAFLWIGCAMPMACKKDDPQAKKIVVDKPTVPVQSGSKLIPFQMGTGKSKMAFSYTADYSLSKIVYGDGTSTVLEFNSSGNPSLLSHYNGDEIASFTQYKLDNSGRVIKGSRYNVVGNADQFAGMFTITYQSGSRISDISYYNSRQILITTEKRLYAESGNLMKEENGTGIVVAAYSYDGNNGLFKNARYCWLFAIEEQNRLFLSDFNNISSCSYPLATSSNQNITYTYNQDNYPETINSQIGGTKLSYKVTYKTIN